MNELDPNYLLPLWRAVVSYFSHHHPLVQADQRLEPMGAEKPAATPTTTERAPAMPANRDLKLV